MISRQCLRVTRRLPNIGLLGSVLTRGHVGALHSSMRFEGPPCGLGAKATSDWPDLNGALGGLKVVPLLKVAEDRGFGVRVEGVTRQHLEDPSFNSWIRSHYFENLLVHMRGSDLAEVSAGGLLEFLEGLNLGIPEDCSSVPAWKGLHVANHDGAEHSSIAPILRMGNTQDGVTGEMAALHLQGRNFNTDTEAQYNPDTIFPVGHWHQDAGLTHGQVAASVLHCKKTPSGSSGDTLFVSTAMDHVLRDKLFTTAEIDRLRQQQIFLDGPHSVRSRGNFDLGAKIEAVELSGQKSEDSLISDAIGRHPETGAEYVNGLGFMAMVFDAGQRPSSVDIQKVLAAGGIDPSVADYKRRTFPKLSQPHRILRISWQVGDIVVSDNRNTMHAATGGYDPSREEREMWRVFVLDK